MEEEEERGAATGGSFSLKLTALASYVPKNKFPNKYGNSFLVGGVGCRRFEVFYMGVSP